MMKKVLMLDKHHSTWCWWWQLT